jgi:hypothetical protein
LTEEKTQAGQAADPKAGSALRADSPQGRQDAGATASAETDLMRRIYQRWGSLINTTIGTSPIPPEFLAAFGTSPIPPEFLAALIANESGGEDTASKFEPTVFSQLQAVRDGKVKTFGSLDQKRLAGQQDVTLRAMATSYGLLQIMGYNGPTGTRGNPLPELLIIPQRNLIAGRDLLLQFCREFYLNPREDFHDLFRCWNTGRPDGKTTDPQYVPNGRRRMEIYRQIAKTGGTQ